MVMNLISFCCYRVLQQTTSRCFWAWGALFARPVIRGHDERSAPEIVNAIKAASPSMCGSEKFLKIVPATAKLIAPQTAK